MKFKDILLESPTDVVARYYIEASADSDRFFNPEDVKYKEETKEYYDKYFKNWFNEGTVAVFKKPVDKPQPEYTNIPKDGKLHSPGYRGLQYALAKSGLPYNHKVQRYEVDPGRIISTDTMNAARNNNGQ